MYYWKVASAETDVSSLMIVKTLPSQVPVRKLGSKCTAEINSLLVDSGNWNLRVIRTYYCYWGGKSKTKKFCEIIFVILEL